MVRTTPGLASRGRKAPPRPISPPTPSRPWDRSRASSARSSGTPWSRGRCRFELKAIQNWVLEREFRKIPGVADVVSWGGGTKQYQVNVDPSRLRGYNLTLKQVFDAVAANNSNAGGSYIPQGQYALTVRGIGLFRGPRDIENVVIASPKGTPV